MLLIACGVSTHTGIPYAGPTIHTHTIHLIQTSFRYDLNTITIL